jgi:putative transposase
MIERDHQLPLALQAAALGISRGSLYYRPVRIGHRPRGDASVDVLQLEYPFARSRMLRDLRRGEGIAIGRGQVSQAGLRSVGISGSIISSVRI